MSCGMIVMFILLFKFLTITIGCVVLFIVISGIYGDLVIMIIFIVYSLNPIFRLNCYVKRLSTAKNLKANFANFTILTFHWSSYDAAIFLLYKDTLYLRFILKKKMQLWKKTS